jgi:(R,R)-butanediol dehydrogenase/meso-butanediol dehydrogenase/diacetyl reductase
MKAAVFYGPQDIRVEEVDEPSPKPGQVKLRNAYAGICGSDLHGYFGPPEMTDLPPHPITGATLPQITGHEFSGTVVELGEGVDGVQVGDEVAVWPIYYCGQCAACRKGLYNICRNLGFHGLSADGGGMAEYTTINASKVHKLPDGVGLRMGALTEPLATSWHAVELSGIQPGGKALVAGAGPIGIGVWFALKGHGVDDVIVSEPNQGRRELIAALGAKVLDPTSEDLAAATEELTGGDGLDVAFDAAGAGVALTSAIPLLGPQGRILVVAVHEKPFEFNPGSLLMVEGSLQTSLAYSEQDFDDVLDAMARGVYDTTGWVDEIDVEQINETMHALRAGNGPKFLAHL